MTSKSIFVYNLFLSLNISDFSFFFVKTASPLKLKRMQDYHKCRKWRHHYLGTFHKFIFHIKCTRNVELCKILPLLNRFTQANNHCISTSWKLFNIKVYLRSTWFHFQLNLLLDFYEKNPCEKKKGCINYFDAQEKPLIFFKKLQKKPSRPSPPPPPPTFLLLLRPCHGNFFRKTSS